MKNIYFFTIGLVCSLMANGQTFTIEQSTTGMTQPIYGQGFTPSIQGSGTGTIGSQNEVGLYEFSFMLSATVTPETLYIYEVLPSSKEVLIDGTGGTLVGQSISKKSESYWYTNYKFNGLKLDKNKMYYALFRTSVNCEYGMSSYSGGKIYCLGSNDAMITNDYVDTKFMASFAPLANTSITTKNNISILIYPNITSGMITINSEFHTIIDVYATTGIKLKSFIIEQGENQESIADLPNGIYIFKSENIELYKVMKK